MNRDSPAYRNTQEWMKRNDGKRQQKLEKSRPHTKIEEHFICVGGWSTFQFMINRNNY